MQLKRRSRGFTLTELAVVFAIVALLVGGAMMTLSAQVDTRNNEETLRRLNAAADAVVAFAIVNKRLPCPAITGGLESFCPGATGTCGGTEVTAAPLPTHGNCSNFYNGLLPAVTIGAAPLDANGFAVDAWGNRLRYAVARDNTGCTTTPPANTRVFTSAANLKSYGVGCRPNDLDICTTAACTARAVSQETAVFVVYSTGKNGANTSSHGNDETENIDGDARFVSRLPAGQEATAGVYDDLLVVVPVGTLYSKLVSAGVLP